MICKDNSRKTGYRERIVHNVKFNITGAITFIKPLQLFLHNYLGFTITKLNHHKGKNEAVTTMEYSGRANLKKLYNFIYKDAHYFLKRKKDKFNEIFCALDEKLSSETGLIAGTPEMVISSEAEKSERSSTIPGMEVESSDSKCPALNK